MDGVSGDTYFYKSITKFPNILNGEIDIDDFLAASTDLIKILDRFGKLFTPVSYDIQGNIDKIRKHYKSNADSCLLKLMQMELNNGKKVAAEGVLWLNRALLFFELTFEEMLKYIQQNDFEVAMKIIFTVAYEGSVKKYHHWVTQKIFVFICKMSPTLAQLLKSLEADHDVKEFEKWLEDFNIKLHLIRCKIDDFFKDNNIFLDDEK